MIQFSPGSGTDPTNRRSLNVGRDWLPEPPENGGGHVNDPLSPEILPVSDGGLGKEKDPVKIVHRVVRSGVVLLEE